MLGGPSFGGVAANLRSEQLGRLLAREAVLEGLMQRNELNCIQRQMIHRIWVEIDLLHLTLVSLEAMQRPRACECCSASHAPLVVARSRDGRPWLGQGAGRYRLLRTSQRDTDQTYVHRQRAGSAGRPRMSSLQSRLTLRYVSQHRFSD
jgi:hypothetical protein